VIEELFLAVIQHSPRTVKRHIASHSFNAKKVRINILALSV